MYAALDVVRMQELNDKTNDLTQAVVVQSGFTDFSRYNSQTKRFSDKFTFFMLDRECAVGTIGPIDAKVVDLDMDDVDENEDDDEETDDDDDDVIEVSENGEEELDCRDTREVVVRSDVMDLRDWINEEC